MGVKVHLHMCVNAHGSQKSTLGIILQGLPTFFSFEEKIFSLGLEFTDTSILAGSKPQGFVSLAQGLEEHTTASGYMYI